MRSQRDEAELIRSELATTATWHLKRMNPAPTQIRPSSDRVVISDSELGVRRLEVERPGHYRFAATPQWDKDPRSPALSRVKTGSYVIKTEDQVDAWLDEAAAIIPLVASKAETDPVYASELPHFEKLTVQRGVDASWFVHHGFGRGYGRIAEVPSRWRTLLRETIREQLGLADARPELKPDPSDTNAGFPTYKAGPIGKILSALVVGPERASPSIEERGRRFSQLVGLPTEASFGFGLSGRSGPLRKWQPLLTTSGTGSFSADVEGIGWKQRNRVVQMSSFGLNRLFRRGYAILNSGRRRMPGFWHPGGPNPTELRRRRFLYEGDISGFDASVLPELLDEFAAAFADEATRLNAPEELLQEIATWRWAQALPLITPSWQYEPFLMAAIFSEGSIRSGDKWTSEVGNALNAATFKYAVERSFGVSDWREAVTLLMFGDDIAFGSDVEPDSEAYAAAYAEVGLKSSIILGDVFLMRHLTLGPRSAPVAGRIIQQTMSNEHERVGPAGLGIAYLGFLARAAGVEYLPADLQAFIWRVVRHASWVADLRCRDLQHLLETLKTDPSVQGEIARALRETEGSEWLLSQVREIDHSVAAAAAVQSAAALGFSSDSALSADLLTELASTRLVAKQGSALRLALAGYEAFIHGTEQDAWRWLSSELRTTWQV